MNGRKAAASRCSESPTGPFPHLTGTGCAAMSPDHGESEWYTERSLVESTTEARSVLDDLEGVVRLLGKVRAANEKILRRALSARKLERDCFCRYSRCQALVARAPAAYRSLIAAELLGIHLRLVGCSNLLSRMERRWKARRRLAKRRRRQRRGMVRE